MLTEKGANVNVVNKDGYSVLDASLNATKGSSKMASILRKKCTIKLKETFVIFTQNKIKKKNNSRFEILF